MDDTKLLYEAFWTTFFSCFLWNSLFNADIFANSPTGSVVVVETFAASDADAESDWASQLL